MDRTIKKIIKKEKNTVKATENLLKLDKKQDAKLKKAKKMKGKC